MPIAVRGVQKIAKQPTWSNWPEPKHEGEIHMKQLFFTVVTERQVAIRFNRGMEPFSNRLPTPISRPFDSVDRPTPYPGLHGE